jgi:hypothetical protein
MPSSGYNESPPNSPIDRQADLPADRLLYVARNIRFGPESGVAQVVWSLMGLRTMDGPGRAMHNNCEG